jgi:hypothetical protein
MRMKVPPILPSTCIPLLPLPAPSRRARRLLRARCGDPASSALAESTPVVDAGVERGGRLVHLGLHRRLLHPDSCRRFLFLLSCPTRHVAAASSSFLAPPSRRTTPSMLARPRPRSGDCENLGLAQHARLVVLLGLVWPKKQPSRPCLGRRSSTMPKSARRALPGLA